MIEEWKDIQGYEGYYQVSNLGRVKSVSRTRLGNKKSVISVPEKILKGGITRGYRTVILCIDSKIKSFSIHRIVANAFIDNPYNKSQVNHIDGIKLNNTVDNLEWTTAQENTQHAWDNGLSRSVKGSDHPFSKLSMYEVIELRKIINSVIYSQRTIANVYNIDQAIISRLKNNKIYKEECYHY